MATIIYENGRLASKAKTYLTVGGDGDDGHEGDPIAIVSLADSETMVIDTDPATVEEDRVTVEGPATITALGGTVSTSKRQRIVVTTGITSSETTRSKVDSELADKATLLGLGLSPKTAAALAAAGR